MKDSASSPWSGACAGRGACRPRWRSRAGRCERGRGARRRSRAVLPRQLRRGRHELPGPLRGGGSRPRRAPRRRSAARRRRPARRRRRPARARRMPAGRLGRALAQRGQEALDVGVVGLRSRPSAKMSVLAAPDRPRDLALQRRRASSAAQLVRDRDVRPHEALRRAASRTNVVEPLRLDVERARSASRGPSSREGGVVHRRRAAVPDGPARGAPTQRVTSSRSAVRRATCRPPRRAPRCSAAGRARTRANVDEKACSPQVPGFTT